MLNKIKNRLKYATEYCSTPKLEARRYCWAKGDWVCCFLSSFRHWLPPSSLLFERDQSLVIVALLLLLVRSYTFFVQSVCMAPTHGFREKNVSSVVVVFVVKICGFNLRQLRNTRTLKILNRLSATRVELHACRTPRQPDLEPFKEVFAPQCPRRIFHDLAMTVWLAVCPK